MVDDADARIAPHLIRSKTRSAQIKNPSVPATHDCLHIGQLGSTTADPSLPPRSSTTERRESLRDDQCGDSVPEQHADIEQGRRIAFSQTLPDHRTDAATIYAPPLRGRHDSKTLTHPTESKVTLYRALVFQSSTKPTWIYQTS